MTQELEPCPKCEATTDDGLRVFKAGTWGVECTCGMGWQGALTEAEAIAAWNTRPAHRLATQPSDVADVERAFRTGWQAAVDAVFSPDTSITQTLDMAWSEYAAIRALTGGDHGK